MALQPLLAFSNGSRQPLAPWSSGAQRVKCRAYAFASCDCIDLLPRSSSAFAGTGHRPPLFTGSRSITGKSLGLASTEGQPPRNTKGGWHPGDRGGTELCFSLTGSARFLIPLGSGAYIVSPVTTRQLVLWFRRSRVKTGVTQWSPTWGSQGVLPVRGLRPVHLIITGSHAPSRTSPMGG